jgi:antitoxin MazE
MQKWGNSLAVRIPKSAAEKAGLKEQDVIEVEVEGNSVIILPVAQREYSLKALLKGVTKKNLHDEEDFGPPVGREAL